ncbi:glycosyltransferase family 2 protein [Anabaena azotica]|uniref:Glycosyltransferase n=1 Tax=Anabaena azotica FACHB-119 TaxID=947527 RepID=A0ABR8D2Z3_9NOST|nr:glycosyltransferase [Anabaena azotica]MBD2501512.1 glycosyltransferase [Anabaena azotica FACHB-119]
MKPLVSILMPCYNAEAWLAETLESVLQQTWDNIEVILVDDGSKDNSLAVAKSFASSKIKIISQENAGQSAAENRALREAQGDFIEYLDADDLLAPDKIEKQIKLLGGRESEFVAAGEWARFYQNISEAQFIAEPVWADMSPVDWLITSWEGGGMMHGAAWLVPRKIAEKAGLWNESLSLINDFDYFSRVLLASKGVKFCWGARTYYRSGLPNNLSSARSRISLESAFRSLELGTNNLLSTENSPRTRHACATAFQRFIYSTYPDAPDLVKQAEAKVQSLGGANLQPEGGVVFHMVANTLGWKSAKRLQKVASKVRR